VVGTPRWTKDHKHGLTSEQSEQPPLTEGVCSCSSSRSGIWSTSGCILQAGSDQLAAIGDLETYVSSAMWLNNCWLNIAEVWLVSLCSLVPRPSHPSVACNTNMGEGLVKLIKCHGIPRHVEEWLITRKLSECATNHKHGLEQLRACHQAVLVTFLGFRVALQLYRRNVPLLHMSTQCHCMWSVLLGLPPC